jgi:serine/threonine protein kinase
MPPPWTIDEFLTLVRRTGVVDCDSLEYCLDQLRAQGRMPSLPRELAILLVEGGVLTAFQAEQLLQGKWKGFVLGKYHILERVASGGMGIVYLAEHRLLHRRVAIKVLPLSLAGDPWFLEQFYTEARAVAALNHPNIVRAHDIDQEGKLHFLILEYVDGSSLQHIVSHHGPLGVERAAHYIRQAAQGLEHAHQHGFVHRDIKPGNLLLDRQGMIKILDMGLVHILRDKSEEQAAQEKRMVGTDDYLAPEQIVDSDQVDARADIYSLGATFYFLLTGRAPFQDAERDHHKLMWHLIRKPKPVRVHRPEVPEALAQVIEKMMAKNPWDRYPTPASVAEALVPWTQSPIPPPLDKEMPRLCPAVQKRSGVRAMVGAAAVPGSRPGRSWVISTQPQAANQSGSILTSESGLIQAQTPTGASQTTQTAGEKKEPPK